MTIKDTLGENTEKLENKAKELAPYYTNLEPWKRGLLLIALLCLLIFCIYWLTTPEKNLAEKKRLQQEAQMEEKILKQMAFFKRLRE